MACCNIYKCWPGNDCWSGILFTFQKSFFQFCSSDVCSIVQPHSLTSDPNTKLTVTPDPELGTWPFDPCDSGQISSHSDWAIHLRLPDTSQARNLSLFTFFTAVKKKNGWGRWQVTLTQNSDNVAADRSLSAVIQPLPAQFLSEARVNSVLPWAPAPSMRP